MMEPEQAASGTFNFTVTPVNDEEVRGNEYRHHVERSFQLGV